MTRFRPGLFLSARLRDPALLKPVSDGLTSLSLSRDSSYALSRWTSVTQTFLTVTGIVVMPTVETCLEIDLEMRLEIDLEMHLGICTLSKTDENSCQMI